MNLLYWRVDRETTTTYELGARSLGHVCLEGDDDERAEIVARVRWDGCTFVTDDRPTFYDPYHICELDDEIGRWQELKALALDYFEGFGIGVVTDEMRERFIREHTSVEGSIEHVAAQQPSAFALQERDLTDDEAAELEAHIANPTALPTVPLRSVDPLEVALQKPYVRYHELGIPRKHGDN